ncbi:MAG: transglycosylase SLT domain-containing protein [Thermoanaerobaculia bacterium]
MIPLLLAVVATAAAADPRPQLVDLVRRAEWRPALTATEEAITADPERAQALGLDHLRGELLARLGRSRDAAEAFVHAMAASPDLAPFARFRLALAQESQGHPEVAAGLVATLLGQDPPPSLIGAAMRLLRRSLESGGDCRLLPGIRRERLPATERRLRDYLGAVCAQRSGSPEAARDILVRLLRDTTEDALALDAADLLEPLAGNAAPEPEIDRLIGQALHAHREFERAIPRLERAAGADWSTPATADSAYALARSRFWRGDYEAAARDFDRLAAFAPGVERRATARYQQARCLELLGRRDAAAPAFRDAFEIDSHGEWSAPSLLGAVRLAYVADDETALRRALNDLAARPAWRSSLARAALFLAVSELERGRPARANDYLTLAERSGGAATEERLYWRGRSQELAGEARSAVRSYAAVLDRSPFHPYAVAARRRLAGEVLAEAALIEARRRLVDGPGRDLFGAWALAGEDRAEGRAARLAAFDVAAADRGIAPWVHWTPPAVESWPIWSLPLLRPEDKLVALGLWREVPGAVSRFFPARDPGLAFAAVDWLYASEAPHRALLIAEALFDRLPARWREPWVDPRLRRLLYPLPWEAALRTSAAARAIPLPLLAAVLREESRFDPEAISDASARGLGQLVLPTARRLAAAAGWAQIRPRDLDRPEVSIAMAAAYLGELRSRFGRREELVVAAYNAGEDQANLWKSYCYSDDPEEFLSKVGFRETRAYLLRVLASRAAYAELYPAPERP